MSFCQDFTPSFNNENVIIPFQNRLDITGTRESNKEFFLSDNIGFLSIDKSEQTEKLNEEKIKSPPPILFDDSDYCVIPEKEVKNEGNIAGQSSFYANENEELTFIFDTKNEQTKLEMIDCLRNIKGNVLIGVCFSCRSMVNVGKNSNWRDEN